MGQNIIIYYMSNDILYWSLSCLYRLTHYVLVYVPIENLHKYLHKNI